MPKIATNHCQQNNNIEQQQVQKERAAVVLEMLRVHKQQARQHTQFFWTATVLHQ